MNRDNRIMHNFFKQAPTLTMKQATQERIRAAISNAELTDHSRHKSQGNRAWVTSVAAVLAGSVSAAGILLYVNHQTTSITRETAKAHPSNSHANTVQVIDSPNGPQYKYKGVAAIKAHAKFPFVLPVGLPKGYVQQTPTLEDNTHQTGGVNPKQRMAMWIAKQGTGTGVGAWAYSISEYAEPSRKDGLWVINGLMGNNPKHLQTEVIDGVTVQYAQLRAAPRRAASIFFYKRRIFYAISVQHGTTATDTQVIKALIHGHVIGK